MKTKSIFFLFALSIPFTQAQAGPCTVGFNSTQHERVKEIATVTLNLNEGVEQALPAIVVPGANISIQILTFSTNSPKLWQNLMLKVFDTSDAANLKEITRATTVVTNVKDIVSLSAGNGVLNANLTCL